MNGIYINSDAVNFWRHWPIEKMNAVGIKEDVDFYVSHGGVKAIFYNMNFQRCYFSTKTGTPLWKDLAIDENDRLTLRGIPLPPAVDAEFRSDFLKTKAMLKNQPDFMQVRYDYCHEKGVEMWHSMRMNDIHYTTLGLEFRPQHNDLWLDRKDLVQAWYRHTWRGTWQDNTLDYGQKEVYDFNLGILKDYLLDYESDGIELDWLRALPVFKPGFDEINTPILTQFMRDARALADEAAKKWGHPVKIAVRVPYLVDEAFGVGMDVPAWGREGLVDVVIPSPQNTSSEQYAQISLWRLLLPEEVTVAACVDYNMMANFSWILRFDNDTDCGFAANYYQQGADTIYLYNHYPRHVLECADMQIFMGNAGNREWVEEHTPRRCIVTRHAPVGEARFEIGHFPREIWPNCCNGGVKVNAGSATADKKGIVIIGATCPLDIDILLNTVKCRMLSLDHPLPRLPHSRNQEAFYVQAEVPADVLHDGWNNIEIFNHSEHTILDSELIWMELMLI